MTGELTFWINIPHRNKQILSLDMLKLQRLQMMGINL
jgi:hypothetical protein